MARKRSSKKQGNGANLGFEEDLCAAADKMRGHSGIAGFVLANGSMSSNQSGEGEIRRKMIEADLVDCMIALPGQLFYTAQIPACLWFLARSKKNGKFRDRRGQTLFIDARKMGALVDRTHRDLTDDDIQRIAKTYHAWRGEKGAKLEKAIMKNLSSLGFSPKEPV
jgi:type I restriction-modification system DNA methylase subunit